MGVDWLSCKNCEDTFPDCGHFVSCECGEHWCSDDCAESDGYTSREYQDEDGDWVDEMSCNFCRGEDYADWELLNFAMEQLGIDREALIKMKRELSK